MVTHHLQEVTLLYIIYFAKLWVSVLIVKNIFNLHVSMGNENSRIKGEIYWCVVEKIQLIILLQLCDTIESYQHFSYLRGRGASAAWPYAIERTYVLYRFYINCEWIALQNDLHDRDENKMVDGRAKFTSGHRCIFMFTSISFAVS